MRNLEAKFQFLIFRVVPRKSRCDQELQYRQTKLSVSLVVGFKTSGLGQGGPQGCVKGSVGDLGKFLLSSFSKQSSRGCSVAVLSAEIERHFRQGT